MNRPAIYAARTVALVLVAGAAWGQSEVPLLREGGNWVRVWEGRLDASGIRSARVSAPGSLRVRGGDGSEVAYRARQAVRARSEEEARRLLQGQDFRATYSNARLEISGGNRHSSRIRTEVDVTLPRTVPQLSCESPGGAIEATGFTGAVTAATAGGNVRVDQIDGPVTVRTAGGSIEIGRVNAALVSVSAGGRIRAQYIGAVGSLESAGGNLEVDTAIGPLRLSTAGGNIAVRRAEATVRANTAGGNIKIDDATGEVIAESGGGSIRVGNATNVRCDSAAGPVYLDNVAGRIRVNAASGSVSARFRNVQDSSLQSAGGDITVYLPGNSTVTVKAVSHSGGSSGRIVSDFPEIQARLFEPARHVPVTEASGTLNGGGPILQISTASGNIYLRRQP